MRDEQNGNARGDSDDVSVAKHVGQPNQAKNGVKQSVIFVKRCVDLSSVSQSNACSKMSQ